MGTPAFAIRLRQGPQVCLPHFYFYSGGGVIKEGDGGPRFVVAAITGKTDAIRPLLKLRRTRRSASLHLNVLERSAREFDFAADIGGHVEVFAVPDGALRASKGA